MLSDKARVSREVIVICLLASLLLLKRRFFGVLTKKNMDQILRTFSPDSHRFH